MSSQGSVLTRVNYDSLSGSRVLNGIASICCLFEMSLQEDDNIARFVIYVFFIIFLSCFCIILLGTLQNFHTESNFCNVLYQDLIS